MDPLSRAIANLTARIGAVLVILGVGLAPLRPFGLEVLRPMVVIALPGIALLVVSRIGTLLAAIRSVPGVLAVIVFSLLGLGHAIGADQVLLLGGKYAMVELHRLIGMSMVFATGIVIGLRRDLRKTIRWPLVAVLLMQALAVVEAQQTVGILDRATGLGADPNTVLLYIIPPAFMLVALMAFDRNEPECQVGATSLHRAGYKRGILQRARMLVSLTAALVVMLAVALALVFTVSQSGLIALGTGVLVLLMSAGLSFGHNWKSLVSTVGAVVVVGMLIFVALITSGVYDEITRQIVERMNAWEYRIADLISGDKLRRDVRGATIRGLGNAELTTLLSPIGVGIRDLTGHGGRLAGKLSHNTFVDTWAVGGFVAFVSYLALYAWTLVRSLSVVWERRTLNTTLQTSVPAAIGATVASQGILLSTLSVLPAMVHWLVLGVCAGVLLRIVPR